MPNPAVKGVVHGRRRHDNSAVRSLRITLEADALQCIGRNCFGGTAGDVRFENAMLELDKNGDGTTDFALLMPGTESIKSANLIL